MSEFLNSDFVYDNIAFLPIGLAALVCFVGGICIFFNLRIDKKKEAFPHTMSNDEYARLNDKRMRE